MYSMKFPHEDDWNISGSDDETDLQQKSKNYMKFDPNEIKKKKNKYSNGGSSNVVPRKVALLYKDIEKNGWIELQCKCPRKGPTKQDSQNYSHSQSSAGSVTNRLENAHIAKDTGQQNTKIKNRTEFQGFDYKEDEERPFMPKPSSAKKTPMSAKRAKKVASMANVVNDLLRQKMLDDKETAILEKDIKNTFSDDLNDPEHN